MNNSPLEHLSKEEQWNALNHQWKGIYKAVELLKEMRQKEENYDRFIALCDASNVLCKELNRLCEESDKLR
jgi:hypothetical protein